MATFVTGGTGFLGRQLVEGILRAGTDLVLLARGGDAAEAQRRVRDLFPGLLQSADQDRLAICRGSLSEPGLGLSSADRDLVLSRCNQFLHAAADVRFDRPLHEARAINVGGTRAILDLARARQRRGGVTRFDHVSTAFVAGRRVDLVGESEFDGRLGHRNVYEITKFEAEQAVREAACEMPTSIFRPSIIVGEHDTGRTSSFQMIYWPARVYARGLWRTCPGHPAAPIDLVPVNIVRDAILALRAREESLGRCFHVAAGPAGSTSLGEMAQVLLEMFPANKPVRFVNPAWWMRLVHPLLRHVTYGSLRQVVRAGEHYVPYFIANPRFDTTGTQELLAGSGVVIPGVLDYVHRLFRYCIESDWGRKPTTRPAAKGEAHG